MQNLRLCFIAFPRGESVKGVLAENGFDDRGSAQVSIIAFINSLVRRLLYLSDFVQTLLQYVYQRLDREVLSSGPSPVTPAACHPPPREGYPSNDYFVLDHN